MNLSSNAARNINFNLTGLTRLA